MVRAAVVTGLLCHVLATGSATAQPGPPGEDRILVTSFADVAALAVGSREVYLAAPAGIAVYDWTADEWRAPLAPLDGYPPADLISALGWDGAAGALWLGTETGELHRLAPLFGRWERSRFRARGPIIRIIPDAFGGVLWIGTPDGWYRVRDDGDSGRFVQRVDQIPAEVRQLGERDIAFEAVQGTLGVDEDLRRYPLTAVVQADLADVYFVGTRGGGLLRLDARTLERRWLPFGSLSTGIAAIATDGGRIWFGGDGQGPRAGVAVASRDLRRWVQLDVDDGAPAGFVAQIVATEDAIWFAASDGVYRLDPRRLADSPARRSAWSHLTTRDGLPADQATVILAAADSGWIGTLRGLARFDGAGRVVGTELVGRRVLDLALAGDTLWVATDAGLLASIGGGAPVAGPGTDGSALRAGPVVAIARRAGSLVALTPDALYRFEGGRWAGPVRDPGGAGLGTLLRLVLDEAGATWIAGERGVVRITATGSVRTWRVPIDVPSGPVRGIALDGDHVWVATPAGALRLDTRR